MTTSTCPCGNDLDYAECCGALHEGLRSAPTAEALMRSRYAAYALKLPNYIVATTDPFLQSPELIQQVEAWMQETTWLRLEVVTTRQGGPADQVGEVEFRAQYQTQGMPAVHHECSRFRKRDDLWYYLDGVMQD